MAETAILQADQRIDRYLRSVRVRLGLRVLATGALVAGAIPVGFLVGWLVRGAPPRGTGWPPGLAVALAAVAVLGVGLVAALISAARQPPAVLRRLRTRDPRLAEALAAALALRGDAPARGNPVSAALAGAHAEQVADDLLRQPPGVLVPVAGVRQGTWALGLVTAAVLAVLAVSPGLSLAALAQFGLGSPTDDLPVILPPSARLPFTVRVEPPAYTGREGVTLEDTTEPIEIVAGSRVEVTLDLPGPVSALTARLREGLTPGQRVPARLAGERTVRISLAPRQDGELVLSWRPATGGWRVGAVGPRFTVLPDRPPSLRVKPGTASIRLVRVEPLTLAWEATDDFGIVEVRLVWTTDQGDRGSRELARAPRFGPGRRTRSSGAFAWDLAALGLAPGRAVTFHLEAQDNRAAGPGGLGPQERRTPDQEVRIVRPEPERPALLADLERLLEAAVARLADRLELPLPAGPEVACAPVGGQVARMRDAERALLSQVAALVAAARRGGKGVLPRLTSALTTRLGPLHGRLVRLAGAGPALPERGGSCAAVRAFKPAHEALTRGLEDLVLLLDELAGQVTLERVADLTREIERQTRELKELAAAEARAPSAERRAALQRAASRLRELYSELARVSSTLRDDLVEDHVNRQALRGKGADEALRQLERTGAAAPPGAKDVAALEKQLERLKQALAEGLDGMRRAYPVPGEAEDRRSRTGIEGLREAQARVNQQLGPGPARPGAPTDPRAELQSLEDRAGRLLAPLKSRAGDEPAAGEAAGHLDRARGHMAEARRALQSGKLEAARRAGERAAADLDRASEAAERAGRLSEPTGTGAAGEGSGAAPEADIPSAGQRLPRELRQRILDAGRSTWPERLTAPLRRYYERLLR
jgi:hypothetical protein